MKRFYKQASVAEVDADYRIELESRPVKTALGNPQIVPFRALAEAMCAEWNAQGEELDAALFRFRDPADFAIDIVRPDRAGTITKLLQFAETDTLCYCAQPDEPFFQRQQQVWEPLLQAFEQREGITMQRVSGIIHQPQPASLHEKMRARLDLLDDFTMTALLTMTSLSASLCIGMAALEEGAGIAALWDAANLEENWQIEQWGEDFEAQAVRKRRTAEFMTAAEFHALLKR